MPLLWTCMEFPIEENRKCQLAAESHGTARGHLRLFGLLKLLGRRRIEPQADIRQIDRELVGVGVVATDAKPAHAGRNLDVVNLSAATDVAQRSGHLPCREFDRDDAADQLLPAMLDRQSL